MKRDEINIEVLADGTIKMTTDKISQANHVNAEGFLQLMARLAGGATEKQRKTQGHTHTHGHDHEHTGH